MNRKTILILIIISTIISIIYILLSYYGIIRYIALHINSTENYINTYESLPKASDVKRVVLSFTVEVKNIHKIKPMLNSLLDQTVKVDSITMVLPNYKEENNDIPRYIKNVCTIFPAGKNYGEVTNIIPLLLKEKECDTIIIALNENYVYGKDFIETIIAEHENNPNTILFSNKTTILCCPDHFDSTIINNNINNYSHDWFSKNTKNKQIKYNENYHIL